MCYFEKNICRKLKESDEISYDILLEFYSELPIVSNSRNQHSSKEGIIAS